MAKIMLLDFEESDYRRLLDKKFDVELRETNWRSGRVESLLPPQDCRVVLYQANLNNYGTGLHAGDAVQFEKIVDEGGVVVCFIGNCQEYHLTNVIGEIPHLKFEENKLPDKIYDIKDPPYDTIFTQFRSSISHAYELFPVSNNLGKVINLREWDPPAEADLQILAESFRNNPISVLLRKGRGFYLLLPWFGEKNIEVAELVLPQVMPATAPQPPFDVGVNWLDSYDYIFPGLLEIYKEMELENEKHRQTMVRLEARIEELKSSEQEQFNKLLTAEGKDLQQAVVKALKSLNWLNVVDVNDYWKRVIRVKEEDIWLLDEDEKSVEQLIRDAPVTMVMVKDGKAGASDEDCLNLQRYKGRRMQEFNNTKLKAVLVGNYFSQIEAKLREVPFSETQVNEAAKDGNGLLTTYELFKAIKAEKEKKTTKEAIREQFNTKVGLITLEY
jgi:hypothetical protein